MDAFPWKLDSIPHGYHENRTAVMDLVFSGYWKPLIPYIPQSLVSWFVGTQAFTTPHSHWNRGKSSRKLFRGCSNTHFKLHMEANRIRSTDREDNILPTRTKVYPVLPQGVKYVLPDVKRHLRGRQNLHRVWNSCSRKQHVWIWKLIMWLVQSTWTRVFLSDTI